MKPSFNHQTRELRPARREAFRVLANEKPSGLYLLELRRHVAQARTQRRRFGLHHEAELG